MAKWTFGKKPKPKPRHAAIENNPAKFTIYQPPEPLPLTEKSDNLGLSASRYAEPESPQQVHKEGHSENQPNGHGGSNSGKTKGKGKSKSRASPPSSIKGRDQNIDEEIVEAQGSRKKVPGGAKSEGVKSTNATTKLQRAPREFRDNVPSYYYQRNNGSTESHEERHTLSEPPTLRPKMSEPEAVARRQSSKRRKRDPSREDEIKHMSASIPPLPERPTTFSGGLLERDNRKIRGGLNRRLQRPMSEVSLPLVDSMHSTLSLTSDPPPMRIRSFDILSPRPTIRYNEKSRLSTIGNSSWDPTRIGSSREHRQPDIPEETMKKSRTVDELADDLDAGALRELMDRDERRKEKKRQSERERAQRRLERKAERQRLELEALQRGGLEKTTPLDMDRGVLGRETKGQDVPRSANEGGKRRKSYGSLRRSRKNSTASSHDEFHPANPFLDREAEDSALATGDPMSTDDPDEAVVETAQAVRVSPSNMSPPQSPTRLVRGTSSTSHLPNIPSISAAPASVSTELDRRASGSHIKRRSTNSWTGFFRRSVTGKSGSVDHGRPTTSEFSSSRDSLPKPQPRPIPLYKTTRQKSGAPVRTASKFREHLPEYPISPPDSRVQSPVKDQHVLAGGASAVPREAADAKDTPTTRNSYSEAKDANHRSVQTSSPDGAASTIVAQSLASIDSEASWLAGRNSASRMSHTGNDPFRASSSSLTQRVDGDELDKHITPLSPGPERSSNRRRKSSGTVTAMSQSDDGITEESNRMSERNTWHDAVARQPNMIDQEGRVKSRDGPTDDYRMDNESDISQTFESLHGDSPPLSREGVQSVDGKAEAGTFTGRHARHISAGSARLLDVAGKSSAEPKS